MPIVHYLKGLFVIHIILSLLKQLAIGAPLFLAGYYVASLGELGLAMKINPPFANIIRSTSPPPSEKHADNYVYSDLLWLVKHILATKNEVTYENEVSPSK